MTTFVLVHGAWHGAWCWQLVADALRAAGHDVHLPTLTGLGERAHLLGAQVDASFHARDLVAHLEQEDLHDVVLVGHSYGSVPATLAAVETEDRLARIVVLDGFVPFAGEATIDLLPPHAAAHYRESAVEQHGVHVIPPRPLDRLGVTDQRVIAELGPRLLPHPLATYLEVLPTGADRLGTLPGTYLQCVGWNSPFDHMRVRAAEIGWDVGSVDGDHEVMVTDPAALIAALSRLGQDDTTGRPGGEFLVRIHTEVPSTLAEEERSRLKQGERVRAMELREAGILQRLWRVTGSRDAVGLFTAPDATTLHDALASLPMFPYQRIDVEALATHPQEAR